MDPARKRSIRLVAFLSVAVVLAATLVYTSFSASSEARTPGELLVSAKAGESYHLTGRVVSGSIRHVGSTTHFRVRDRAGTASIPVRYASAVPDTFRAGREIIIVVDKRGGSFVGQRDSLITKCPSKFSDRPQSVTA